jgi:hypothetical protein
MRLKELFVSFPPGMQDDIREHDKAHSYNWSLDEGPDQFARPTIDMFSGLQSLTLEHIYNDLFWWRSQIVQLLKSSPGLKHLGLSATPFHGGTETNIRFFFDSLCEDYGQTGSAPLRLRSLSCSYGIYPLRLSSLEKLTDLAQLERVTIDCRDGLFATVVGEIAFDAFGPAHAPNLRRVTAVVDIYRLLPLFKNSSFSRQLDLCCFQWNHWLDISRLLRPDPEHPALPLQFRVVNILLKQEGDVPVYRALDDLVSNDTGALEGLTIHETATWTTDAYFERLMVLECALPILVNLTRLRILVPFYERPQPPAGRLPSIVERLAISGRRLRYIGICWHYYRIWRNGDGTVSLERLDEAEACDVELFSRGITSRRTASSLAKDVSGGGQYACD